MPLEATISQPWIATAGSVPDDELTDEWIDAIEEYREERDAEDRSWRNLHLQSRPFHELFILDTNVLTLYERMHPAVMKNIFHHFVEDIRVSSITVEEQVSGWFRLLRSAKSPQQLEAVHRRLSKAVSTLGTWEIIPLSAQAEMRSKSSCEDTSTSKATTF